MNPDTDLTPFPDINSRRTPDLNVKCRTRGLSESGAGETRAAFGGGGLFRYNAEGVVLDEWNSIRMESLSPATMLKQSGKTERRRGAHPEYTGDP